MNAAELWALVAKQLAEHVKPGDGNWEGALNRIAREMLVPKGVYSPPRLGPDGCDIELVTRDADELRSVEKHRDWAHHGLLPPVLLRFWGREFAIDGHHRINQYLQDGRTDPLKVILLSVRGEPL